MMEAARSSETLVNFYQTTQHYNPEDSHLHTNCCENLKSYLKQGEYKLVRETKLKSVIWQRFVYIFDGDEKLKDVVGCFMCKQVCSYTGHKSVTSNLIKHKCETGQKNITSFISVKTEVRKPEVSSNL
jgi:hypothetical protein